MPTTELPINLCELKQVSHDFQLPNGKSLRVLEPVGYLEMLDLERSAYAAVTDSGGVQEETTVLNVPCFTVRDNTERPATITHGTNQLVRDIQLLPELIRAASVTNPPRRPEGWDGAAGERIIDALVARS